MIDKKLLVFIGMFCVVAGCASRKKVAIKSPEVLHQQEMIAKFADIPDAPFQAQLQKIAVSSDVHDQVQLFYTFSMPQEDIITFYQQQMERLGWELLAESTVHDYVMYYSKPAQLCSIILSQNYLKVYVCNKKGA